MAAIAAGMGHAACTALCPLGETPVSLSTHTCFGLCLGARTGSQQHVAYHGLTLGLAHASMREQDVMRVFCDEQCDFNGASVQLLSQLNRGTVRGLSLTGCVAVQQHVRGVQFSGLANDAQTVKGAQIALGINLAQTSKGVQIGVLNVAKELVGVQVGLLNINRAGWTLPLINISW